MINEELKTLASLIKTRNNLEIEVAKIIERPFIVGHIGEYIASSIFDIELNASASAKGHDGFFKAGEIKGSTVNIKYYSRKGSILDISKTSKPDFYLVLMGSSIEKSICPWDIDNVYLFSSKELHNELDGKVKIGVATSVRKDLWERAMIYPNQNEMRIKLNEEKIEMLKLFK